MRSASHVKRVECARANRFATGHAPAFDLPNVCIFLIAVALLAAFFLNRTIWGRYLFALGRNEEAARFSGIRTDRMVILTYVICAALAALRA